MYQILPFIYLPVYILLSKLVDWSYETVVQIVCLSVGALLLGTSAKNVPPCIRLDVSIVST